MVVSMDSSVIVGYGSTHDRCHIQTDNSAERRDVHGYKCSKHPCTCRDRQL
jgi:hypothetical protein